MVVLLTAGLVERLLGAALVLVRVDTGSSTWWMLVVVRGRRVWECIRSVVSVTPSLIFWVVDLEWSGVCLS